MKTHARVLVAVLGSLAFFSQASGEPSANKHRLPGEVIPSDIYDPLGLVSRHGELVSLEEGFSFTEGPAVDRHGNVFFTDQPNDRIYRWDARTGKVKLFLEGTGRANGMAFDDDGNLIAAADLHG